MAHTLARWQWLTRLGPVIDNNQTLMTLSIRLHLVFDKKNNVTLAHTSYPSLGAYLPGNLLTGSTTGTGAAIQGPTLLGHLNTTSTTAAPGDNSGTCTLANVGGTTECSFPFQSLWQNAPVCVANDMTRSGAILPAPTSSMAIFKAGSGALSGDTVAYHCQGNPN